MTRFLWYLYSVYRPYKPFKIPRTIPRRGLQQGWHVLTAVTRFFSFLCSVYRPSDSSSSVVVPSLDPQATSRPCSCTRRLCKGTSHTCQGQGQNMEIHVTRAIKGWRKVLSKKRTFPFHLTSHMHRKCPFALPIKWFWAQLQNYSNDFIYTHKLRMLHENVETLFHDCLCCFFMFKLFLLW